MLKGSYFAVDATPLTGTPLAYDIQIAVDDPLYLKGFVFLRKEKTPLSFALWTGSVLPAKAGRG